MKKIKYKSGLGDVATIVCRGGITLNFKKGQEHTVEDDIAAQLLDTPHFVAVEEKATEDKNVKGDK